MQVLGAASFADLVEPRAQRFVGWWTDEEGVSQCAQVKTGAADEQWNASAAFDLFDLLRGLACPFDGRVIDVRTDEVYEVMWNTFAFVEWDFCGGYFDLFVDLDRVTVDYLAVDFEGDIDAESALAGGGWAYDSEHANEYNEPEDDKQNEAGEELVTCEVH